MKIPRLDSKVPVASRSWMVISIYRIESPVIDAVISLTI